MTLNYTRNRLAPNDNFVIQDNDNYQNPGISRRPAAPDKATKGMYLFTRESDDYRLLCNFSADAPSATTDSIGQADLHAQCEEDVSMVNHTPNLEDDYAGYGSEEMIGDNNYVEETKVDDQADHSVISISSG